MANSEKPILFVLLSRFPYPLEKGDKLRAFHQLKEFSRHFTVHLHCISDENKEPQEIAILKEFCSSVHIYNLPRWVSYLQTLLALFSSKPLQIGYFYSYRIHQKIKKSLRSTPPDHVFCQLIRCAEYVKDYHQCPKTIDYMDAFSKGVERRIPLAPWYLRWAFRLENERLRRYESRVFDYFEIQTIISEQDRDCIRHPNKNQMLCIPNGVDASFFDEKYVTTEKEFDLVFVGNLSYPPNIEAIKFITEDIRLELNKLDIQPKILIAGANPYSGLEEKLNTIPKVNLQTWVENIKWAYSSGKIFVAPMFIGTGLQNKLLEAMALGVPCITTSLANNALKADEKEEIRLANSAVEFAQTIQDLLHANSSDQVGVSGRAFVAKMFQWEGVSRPLVQEMLKR